MMAGCDKIWNVADGVPLSMLLGPLGAVSKIGSRHVDGNKMKTLIKILWGEERFRFFFGFPLSSVCEEGKWRGAGEGGTWGRLDNVGKSCAEAHATRRRADAAISMLEALK